MHAQIHEENKVQLIFTTEREAHNFQKQLKNTLQSTALETSENQFEILNIKVINDEDINADGSATVTTTESTSAYAITLAKEEYQCSDG